MGVAIVDKGSPSYYNAATETLSVTLTAGATLLVVRHVNRDNTDAVSAMSYNGVALTKLVSQTGNASVGYATIWYLVNPATGAAHNLVITLDGSSHHCEFDYLSLSGVNTTTPFGTPAVGNSHSTSMTAGAVTSAVGDMVIDVGLIYQDTAPSVSISGGQTLDSSTAQTSTSADPYLATSHIAGAASVTPSWSITTAHYWGYIAVNVKAGSSSVTKTLSATQGQTAALVRGVQKKLSPSSVAAAFLSTVQHIGSLTLSAPVAASMQSEFPFIFGAQGGATLSLQKIPGGKILAAAVSPVSFLSIAGRYARELLVSQGQSASLDARGSVSILLTVSASAVAMPLMWFRRALRMIPAVITSLSSSPAQVVELEMTPDEHA